MKIQNKAISHYASKELVFPRANDESFKLIVRSVPIGWQRGYEAINPRPSVPMGPIIATNSGAKSEPNFNDVKFLAALSDWQTKETYYLVYLLVKDTPGLVFDSPPVSVDAFDKFITELANSGISEMELAAIAQAGHEISRASAEEVAKAREGFTAK